MKTDLKDLPGTILGNLPPEALAEMEKVLRPGDIHTIVGALQMVAEVPSDVLKGALALAMMALPDAPRAAMETVWNIMEEAISREPKVIYEGAHSDSHAWQIRENSGYPRIRIEKFRIVKIGRTEIVVEVFGSSLSTGAGDFPSPSGWHRVDLSHIQETLLSEAVFAKAKLSTLPTVFYDGDSWTLRSALLPPYRHTFDVFGQPVTIAQYPEEGMVPLLIEAVLDWTDTVVAEKEGATS